MIVDVDKLLAANTEIHVRDISEFNMMMDALNQSKPSDVRRWMKDDGTWKHPWGTLGKNIEISRIYFVVNRERGLTWGVRQHSVFDRNAVNFCDVVTYDDEDDDIGYVDDDVFLLMG